MKQKKEMEYYIKVTLRIPSRLVRRITKKAIQSKDVQVVAVDWDKMREVWSENNLESIKPQGRRKNE